MQLDNILVPTTPKPKPKRISKKVRRALDLLISGECRTQVAAAQRAGVSESYLSRALQEPVIKQLFLEKANRTIVTAAPRAAARMSDLMESESSVAAFQASRFLLGTVGIKPADTNVNVNVGIGVAVAGYCIDLRHDDEIERDRQRASAKVIDVTPEQP